MVIAIIMRTCPDITMKVSKFQLLHWKITFNAISWYVRSQIQLSIKDANRVLTHPQKHPLDA